MEGAGSSFCSQVRTYCGDEVGSLFGGAMADPGDGDQLRVQEPVAELRRGVNGDGAIAVAPEDEAGSSEGTLERAAQTGHIVMPGLEQAKQMQDGSGGAEIVAVGLETIGRVPALGAGHAAQADHLQPLGQPGHEVGEELAGLGEIEADQRIALAEVGMRGREQHQRMHGMTVMRGEAHGHGSAMGVTENDGLVEVELGEEAADLLGGGGQAGIDVLAAFGLAGSGKVECDDVEVGLELLHQRNEGVRAAHQSMDKDERWAGPSLPFPFRGTRGEGHPSESGGVPSWVTESTSPDEAGLRCDCRTSSVACFE